MNAVRAVLLDLDDTLLDGRGHREAIVRACADHEIRSLTELPALLKDAV